MKSEVIEFMDILQNSKNNTDLVAMEKTGCHILKLEIYTHEI